MTRPQDPPEPHWSRRQVLKNVGKTAAVAASVGVVGGRALTAAEQANRHRVSGIDPRNLADEYERRGLDTLGDAELCRQAAAIISRPPVKGGSSFSLHAPLELLARYGLLPLVEPQERLLARLQLV